MHTNKNGSIIKKIIIILLCLFLIIVISGSTYFYLQLGKVKKIKLPNDPSELGISKKNDKKLSKYNDIYNIAFFGIDSRQKDDAGRSDTIMILTLDGKHNKVKFSSIMRDTYVKVDGHGMTKITHAYAYGGPQLALKTINENFNLNIKDFATVDFFDCEKIIDKLGGITINITPDELKYINGYIDEVSKLEKKPTEHITKAGTQLLNGRQAVAYSRIRYTAGGDYERTERQRTVLSALLNKIRSRGASNFSYVANVLLPYVKTNLNRLEIVNYGLKAFTVKSNGILQHRFPEDSVSNGIMKDGVWYLQTDIIKTADEMQKFIFEK